ncbi:hypothetical protein FNV43_RR26688 [Rhamnella rubrinervis]|uniref:Uncharacterized protein n=1 Tax=Rhamnella rubrinervis TaxID=2594499 RepID=A0A8K0GJW0_9ROSA|nr:hypothetical protein FNV43_RR26688 [Rhamnella rubrinervis]
MEGHSNAQSSSDFMSDRLELDSLFAGLDDIDFGPVSRSDWTDDRFLNLKGIVLRRYNPTQLAPIVKEGLASLQGTITHRSIGAILVSAWNLYFFPERKYVFPDVPLNKTPDDEDYTTLSVAPFTTSSGAEIQWPVDDSVTSTVGAYVCACLLRLATKPASNFVKSWGHIKHRYSDLNKRLFEIRGLNPVEKNLDSIRIALSNWPLFKNTLTRFLYHFNELRGSVKGFARFTFEQHLSLAGLHSYSLFTRIAAKLEADTDELSLSLANRMTQRGLELIKTILINFEGSTDEKQRRQTWKYARLFDAEMFTHLQTKNCTQLTCVLAMILKEVGDDEGGDVTQIVYIQNLTECLRDRCQKTASEVIQRFTSNAT